MSTAIERLEYLGEALRTLMQETHAGDATGHWDGTECDGLCLSEDFDGAIDDAKSEIEALTLSQKQAQILVLEELAEPLVKNEEYPQFCMKTILETKIQELEQL